MGQTRVAGLVALLLDRQRQAEDLLVGEVGERLQTAQPRRQVEPAARLAAQRRGERDGVRAGQPRLLEEALALPLEAVEGGVQVLLPVAEDARQLAVAPAEDLLERLDAPPQAPDPLLVRLVEQQEGVHGGGERRLVAFTLVLGPPQALGDLAVEGVETQRLGELADGAVEVLAPEEEAAVQLVDRGVDE